MKNFLMKNSVVFAWSTVDMPGISPMVIMHVLNVSPEERPVRQKKRKSSLDRIQAIKEEIEKLHKAGFIREI